MSLQRIKSLTNKAQYDEALAECENVLKSGSDPNIDVLRQRAHIFALQDDYLNALRDEEAILATGDGALKDYYHSANYALHAGELEKSVHRLKDLLRLGEEQGEDWFKSAACLLLAYAYMELGNYAEAIHNVDSAMAVEADCAMPLPEVGMCSADQLKKEITRRKDSGH